MEEVKMIRFYPNIVNKILRKIEIVFTRESPDKIRMRTTHELEIRKSEFLKICNSKRTLNTSNQCKIIYQHTLT